MYMTYRFRIFPTQAQMATLRDKFYLARKAFNQLVDLVQPDTAESRSPKCNQAQSASQPYQPNENLNGHDSVSSGTSPNLKGYKLPSSGTTFMHVLDELLNDHNRFNLTDRYIVIHIIRQFEMIHKQALIRQTKIRYKTAKFCTQTICLNRQEQNIHIKDKTMHIKLLGSIKGSFTRKVNGRIIYAILSLTATGKYYICLLVKRAGQQTDVKRILLRKKIRIVGIDMGLHSFLTLSDGRHVANPRHFDQRLDRIRRINRQLSRQQKGSNNRKKTRHKLARAYEHLKNERNGFLHRLSSELVRDYDIIAVESLDIRHLIKSRQLSRQISDAAWRKFLNYLKYKADWHGKMIIELPRYLPSSKRCCRCGKIKNDLELKDRTWQCPHCMTHHDRDTNAAINILIAGTRQLLKQFPEIDQTAIKPALSSER